MLACTPETMVLIYWEMYQCVRDGLSILILVADAVRVFGDMLKLSRISVFPQEH